ncbi:cobamide remodeling phosphodiesterase CbiR [Maridesulfovibrio zosterae]|uniref:cobamide remodeling phosphodiesterase CbiR n=1 Tax=Maridesulfovibrio zosterae TaxID=82171 RepID=UPI0003F86045|nr:cobamide remodeling phosphodiesterase CbiR [Maridesulfovibrio zosterae]
MTLFANKTSCFYKLAAPSWVIPGNIAENCRYLAGKVDEIALLFFETESCLSYTEEDLPSDLAECGLSFHIHHPLDLPWHKGGARVAEIVLALNEKAAHLNPLRHVVHPPAAGNTAEGNLRDFASSLNGAGIRAEQVLFENTKINSLGEDVAVIRDLGFKICLDLGHILAYAQQSILKYGDFAGLVDMIHLNSPGIGGKHESLELLDDEGINILNQIFDLLSADGTVTVEVFEEKSFFNSLQFLDEYCSGKKCSANL